jgi:hypothetical protein
MPPSGKPCWSGWAGAADHSSRGDSSTTVQVKVGNGVTLCTVVNLELKWDQLRHPRV